MNTIKITKHKSPNNFQSLVIPIRRGGRELPNQGTKVESKHTNLNNFQTFVMLTKEATAKSRNKS